jgi:hypothetical protein
MTWTIAKIAAAGVLTAMPIAAVAMPACAVASSGSAPIVLQAPLPADPQIDPQPAPPSPHGEYYNPNDYNDWYNWYNSGADGGGGGGGGG